MAGPWLVPGVGFLRAHAGKRRAMFLFFSNRMGCGPSLLMSAVVTLILPLATGIVDL